MPHDEFSSEPPGFSLHQSCVIDGRDTNLVKLYLPIRLKSALDHQKNQERELRIAEARAEELRDFEERSAQRRVADGALLSQKRAGAEETLVATSLLPMVAGEDYDPRQKHPVYAPDTPSRLLGKAGMLSADKDVRKRDEELGRKLTSRGNLRTIAAPDHAIESLAALRRSQPHFGEVIDLVLGQLMLAARSRRGARIPPLLLDGEPGIGKTHFAIELAKALNTTVRRIAFDSAINGATLMGSDRRWSNTQFGILFELICLGEHANPVVILDEIDKAGARREWDPLAPLHTLLEPSTATQARDISVDFEFDASKVIWIATSNDATRLLPSLRSRFREFRLQRPGAADAIVAAEAVIGKVIEEMALIDFEAPSKPMAVALAHLSAREVRQALEQAIAHAVAHGRNRVTPDDLPTGLLGGDGTSGSSGSSGKKNWLH